jgi:acyl-CoA thioester hydrolase
VANFEWPVRVYYEDTDTAGVVYYANYLKFLERARTEWLRSLGFEQDVLIRDHDVVFAVRSVTIDYLKPARFNDALIVRSSVGELRRASLLFEQAVVRPEAAESVLLASAQVGVVALHARSLRPRPIPPFVREAIESDH